MIHPKYEVTRLNGKYVIKNDHYLNSSTLLKEIAEAMVYLQETAKAEFTVHLGHQENIMLSESMREARRRQKEDLERRMGTQ